MLIQDADQALGQRMKDDACQGCGQPATIFMTGDSRETGGLVWCSDCALQISRKLLEDLCALLTKGGRHS